MRTLLFTEVEKIKNKTNAVRLRWWIYSWAEIFSYHKDFVLPASCTFPVSLFFFISSLGWAVSRKMGLEVEKSFVLGVRGILCRLQWTMICSGIFFISQWKFSPEHMCTLVQGSSLVLTLHHNKKGAPRSADGFIYYVFFSTNRLEKTKVESITRKICLCKFAINNMEQYFSSQYNKLLNGLLTYVFSLSINGYTNNVIWTFLSISITGPHWTKCTTLPTENNLEHVEKIQTTTKPQCNQMIIKYEVAT